MTPAADPLDRGASATGAESPEAWRRRYLRRRVTAAAAALLVVVWIASLVSSGGSSGRPAPARPPVTGADVRSAAAARRTAATIAEQQREDQAIQSALSYTAFVTAGSAAKREMALTFDDGPGPFTPQVLGVLRRMHVPATFFLVGRSIKDFGAYVPTELA
ncbi:MAG TPA: polysaccharide deacetylase family protein, partial [Solirubrobacteraceae bacterium]|nr:polysaccharide deacetylase family protein [Solirubrobacteraceae bacterium]